MGLQVASDKSSDHERLQTPAPLELLRILTFCVIGTLAACVHFFTTIFCVEELQCTPLIANIAGYLLGLITSYTGQSRFTFRRARFNDEPYLKFALTSLSGLALNSLLFALLLNFTSIDYRLALVLVLMLVAMFTFIVMDRWVFAGPNKNT